MFPPRPPGPFLNTDTGRCTNKQGPRVVWNLFCFGRVLGQLQQQPQQQGRVLCGGFCIASGVLLAPVAATAGAVTAGVLFATGAAIADAADEACFGLDTLVTTVSGKQKLMRDLKIGEEVLSDETGRMTKVLGWLELNYKERVSFLEIKTHDGEELIMTETHIVFYYEDGEPTPAFIRDLKPGNVLVGGTVEVSPNYPNQFLIISYSNFAGKNHQKNGKSGDGWIFDPSDRKWENCQQQYISILLYVYCCIYLHLLKIFRCLHPPCLV